MKRNSKSKKDKIISVAQLCIPSPKNEGNIEGVCCICGMRTQKGFPAKFSGNFTGYSFLSFGNCICPCCHEFFKNQDFRRKSWVATLEGVKFLERTECRKVLLNPPSPPFFIYITKTGQRQGWLSALRLVNFRTRDYFCISTDFVGHFWVHRKEVRKADRLISRLRGKKVSKKILLSGEFSMYVYRKAMNEGWQGVLEEVKGWIKKPIWEVMVYVSE